MPVLRGMTHDGLGKYLSQRITKAPGATADIVAALRESQTDVVVSYLPVGSEQATKWYVEQILEAGCAFVNCIPVFIAREDYWNRRFKKAGLPMIGDDIKSQVGATIVHRALARLMADRGVRLAHTSQLNVGGNMDFFNMLERERLESKKISKTNAVTSIMGNVLPAEDVHVGPSDYVPWLTDRKWAHIRLEGQAFGDVPLNIELKLEVWDSPNSAGIVIDAVRCCKLALNNGVSGQLDGPSSYLMKSPYRQRPDDIARTDTEKFIARYARRALRRSCGRPSRRPAPRRCALTPPLPRPPPPPAPIPELSPRFCAIPLHRAAQARDASAGVVRVGLPRGAARRTPLVLVVVRTRSPRPTWTGSSGPGRARRAAARARRSRTAPTSRCSRGRSPRRSRSPMCRPTRGRRARGRRARRQVADELAAAGTAS